MFGRRKLPPSMRPELERDERVLAWAATDGGVLIATNRGLWLPGKGRLGWHEIHKATWVGGVLTVIGAWSEPLSAGSDISVSSDTAPSEFRLPQPDRLPQRVRERVTASVAHTSLHQLPGGGAARIVARRISGRDGLFWFARYEGPVDPSDPAVIAATRDLVIAAKEGVGA